MGQTLKNGQTTQALFLTYADDTSTSCHGKSQEELMEKLEENSKNILQFMASNGLVANESKTVLMILRRKFSQIKQVCNV
jgi:hypothetical protein